MEIQNKTILIFSGYNQRAVIAFLRTLKKLSLPYAIIAKSPDDSIFQTEYKKDVKVVRKSTSLILEDIMASVKEVKKGGECVIAPSTEALNRCLITHRSSFEENGCVIPLVKKDIYKMISDKYSFGKACQEFGILVPEEISGEGELSAPFVAKPKSYFSSKGEILSPVIIDSKAGRDDFFQAHDRKDFYFQRKISGKSLYLLYYFHNNGSVFKFSQQNLIQQAGGGSIIAAIADNFHLSKESNKYEQLFKRKKYRGLVMVEIRQENRENYMIEANPRFWGPSQLFIDAGVNLFEVFLHDIGLIGDLPKLGKEKREPTRYFWSGGVSPARDNMIFYNYTMDNFLNEYPQWIKHEVYARPDTEAVYEDEKNQSGGEC